MGKKYSKQQIDNLIQDTQDFSKLYAFKFIQYAGNIKGTKIPYIEYIAERLLDTGIVDKLKGIQITTRKNSYKVKHSTKSNNKSNRKEEIFAKSLIDKQFDVLGKIIDYQVPLKNEQKDKCGKIDLVSFNSESKCVYLIELKYVSKETLLRSVLEIATYFQQLDKDKFLEDFNHSGNEIKKAVLILKDSTPYEDFKNLKNMPNLNELIHMLRVSIFVIENIPDIKKVL